MHYTGAMIPTRPELRLTTTRVAYFKKLITRQNHLCSEVKLCFNQDGLTMYGTSATESVILTLSIGKIFFEHYECNQSRIVRINIYHLYKIIKRATSFMYQKVNIHIFKNKTGDDTPYNWMHLVFETENRTDKFHTRVYSADETSLPLSRESLVHLSPSQTIQIKIDGALLMEALNKFDKDVFQTVTFTLRGKCTPKRSTTTSTKLYTMDMKGHDALLVVRGKTDCIHGNVSVQTMTKMTHSKHLTIHKHKYSLELLCKSMTFYKLSHSSTCSIQFFPQFKLMCITYNLPHNVFAEVILPHIPNTVWDDSLGISSASDNDDSS